MATIDASEDEAMKATTMLLASTAATLKQATDWTASCNATREEVQASLETWLAQGVGHQILYSRNCTDIDDQLTAGLLGDMSSRGEDMHASNEDFNFLTVSKLSSYAVKLKTRMLKAEVLETMLDGCATWSPRA